MGGGEDVCLRCVMMAPAGRFCLPPGAFPLSPASGQPDRKGLRRLHNSTGRHCPHLPPLH